MSFEDFDYSKIHAYSEQVRNTEGLCIDGQEITILNHSFKDSGPMLASLEKFVHDIEFSADSVGFDIKRRALGISVTVPKEKKATLRYFDALKAFQAGDAFSERYIYSPHVAAVQQALTALELTPVVFGFQETGSFDRRLGKTHGELFNDVVAKIAEIVGTSAFREQLRVRERNAKRNEEKALAIERQVYESKSRHLVLMVHFGFKQRYRHQIMPEDLQRFRKKFFNNCRSNKLLRGIVDYIWKVEQGDESGLHLHLLIFYTAASCRDVQIAKAIGEYWVDVVTEGKGQYWNSNANKWLHAQYGHGVGTGEINWDDDKAREALRANIRYMTKAEQFLRAKIDGCRLFGTSQVKEKKKGGRPRKP